VISSQPEAKDAGTTGQVLRFYPRPRGHQLLHSSAVAESGWSATAPEDDLARYEQDQEIDYRQRMLMNVIAVAICTMLIGAGVWIADTIAEMQRDQDCVLQGRVNCAPIPPLPNHR
jgi:hypothetical protein